MSVGVTGVGIPDCSSSEKSSEYSAGAAANSEDALGGVLGKKNECSRDASRARELETDGFLGDALRRGELGTSP